MKILDNFKFVSDCGQYNIDHKFRALFGIYSRNKITYINNLKYTITFSIINYERNQK